MGFANVQRTLTTTAGADMNTSAFHYKAIALDDGLVAANGDEAGGILISKPKSGEHTTLVFDGIAKYVVGSGGATKGQRLTVVASGFFAGATSGSGVVGRALEAINSGSIGAGVFNFAGVAEQS